LAGLAHTRGAVAAWGLGGAQKAFLVAGLARALGRPFLWVTPDLPSARAVARDLAAMASRRPVLVFPALDVLPYEVAAQSPELRAERLRVLSELISGGEPWIVSPAPALLRALCPVDVLRAVQLEIAIGDRLDPEALAVRVQAAGYRRVDVVAGPGEWARRGAIADIYPPTSSHPWRIEFGPELVEDIRGFDAQSQRSLQSTSRIVIPPAQEYPLPADAFEAGLARLEDELDATQANLRERGLVSAAIRLAESQLAAKERLRLTRSLQGLEYEAPFFYPELYWLGDYLKPDYFVVLDEPARLQEAFAGNQETVREEYRRRLHAGELLPSHVKMYLPPEEATRAWRGQRGRAALYLSILPRQLEGVRLQASVTISSRPAESFQGQWPAFVAEVRRWQKNGFSVAVLSPDPDEAAHLKKSLQDEGLSVLVYAQELTNGFVLPDARLAVVTRAELHPTLPRRPRVHSVAGGARLRDLQELRPGDYVVHEVHGIGRYAGMHSIQAAGVTRDYISIEYAGGDMLRVPVDQLDRVQRYIGPEDTPPRISRLGAAEWSHARARVERATREMAEELLRLYAARVAHPGHAFSPDTPWQAEFEERFPYEETPDQLRATEEIKRDMERPVPMDRLLVGDVGYGKTEVAIRAAFKAVMDGKQVAVLVPTTILAQQHYMTFRERFQGYPVGIALLSRFQSPAEQKKTVAKLRSGQVDIVIGTHRLLNRDVVFKDLGLLIIDEEHRFGVAHKEKIKKLKTDVDVLSMSATPIPRTLYMGLTGLRDISVIESPPPDRYPVQTYVVEKTAELITSAINRELDRGGQVFYVHNRVETIDTAAAFVQDLVPHARVRIAHGQMAEKELEQVMLDFAAHQCDVLVCTSIIESGLDLPNANTLIVEDADRLGLAQLYQLRGRVGRSHRLAYAYFLYDRDKVMTEAAEQRLDAIRGFTELGAGFKIAQRDLEIRGAGDLLGPEQHGQMAAVGFDLYIRLLEQAVRELRGESVAAPPEPVIELPVDAYLPASYIEDEGLKIEMYKSLLACRTEEDVLDVERELRDRFGPLPAEAQALVDVARVKNMARALGVISIAAEKDTVTIRWNPQREVPVPGYVPVFARGRLWPLAGQAHGYSFRFRPEERPTLLARVYELLQAFGGRASAKDKASPVLEHV